MSVNKRIYVRPKNPSDPTAEAALVEGLVAFGMACKNDYERRQAAKRNQEGGSAPPPSVVPAAAKSK